MEERLLSSAGRWAFLALLLAAVSAGLAACGGASDEEIAQAERQGATKEKQRQRLNELERKLDEGLKDLKGDKNPGRGAEPNPPRSSGSPGGDGSTDCGNGLSVNSVTSCDFAENVRAVYEATIAPGAGEVESFSNATGKWYVMDCTAGVPHECTGGVGAALYFP